MNPPQNPQQSQSSFPVPVDSNEGSMRFRLIRRMRRPLLILVFLLFIETVFGHPAIRWSWVGASNDPQSMSVCICKTVTGEEHVFAGYRSLVTFVRKPNFTLSGWALRMLGLKD